MRVQTCVVVASAVLALGAGDVARAGDSTQAMKELQALLASLASATDPGERKALVRNLAATTSVRAAERLRRIVRTDPDPSVRAEAAAALGRIDVPEALGFLVDLVVLGGPREVRRAVGRAIARRDGRAALLAAFEKATDDLGRGLVLEALADDTSLAAAEALERFAAADDAHVRVEAVRALARHPSGKLIAGDTLKSVLAKRHDVDTILACIDIAETLDDTSFRPLADLLSSFLEPEVQRAVAAVRRRLAYIDACAAAKQPCGGSDYAPATDTAPEPPPVLPRADIVYLFDATGSVSGHIETIKERIRREAATLASIDTDLRIGVVAYRDTPKHRDLWATRSLPLTHDLARVLQWIDAVKIGGSDSQGACITEALEQSMDRMGWRWNAQRQVGLIADSKTGDPERSRDLVRLHYSADRTHLRVWYLYRTRTQLPPDVEELARIGGGLVESLE
ncbi:MAG: HEAT repeat domain-containing protein [Planctomycetes bacterium]|nr:HEAT repeat domain-containing protein [Planctomycetota bacterium]